MVTQYINLVKLCVGVASIDDLSSRIDSRKSTETMHVTRMWPKKSAELLNGGSLYWVIKGVILARQRILSLDEQFGDDGIRRCGIRMDATLHRTEAARRRPFQGWRYMTAQDAPRDLAMAREHDDDLPPELIAQLAQIGVR
ncbi:MAG: DUF1489 domain-containing protein [Marinosulfonomonas sp.]|nr:DUF1489 domain-containing protein [Marinosulfonomonas sp.]